MPEITIKLGTAQTTLLISILKDNVSQLLEAYGAFDNEDQHFAALRDALNLLTNVETQAICGGWLRPLGPDKEVGF